MDGCILGLIFWGAVGLYFTLGLRVKAEPYTPPERHVDARHIDPAETYRTVMEVVDEVHGRWLEGRYGDEVIHLHLPSRAEMARYDLDLRLGLRSLEEDYYDVILHYEGEQPIYRLAKDRPAPSGLTEWMPDPQVVEVEHYAGWDKAVFRNGRMVRGEWRQKEPGCLPLLGLIVVVVVGVLVW